MTVYLYPMQGATHVLVGISLEKIFNKKRMKPMARFVVIAVLGLFLHSVFDRIARITYHPPDARYHDPFWVGWHLVIYSLTIYMLVKYWRHYPIGITFSILPDFDWVILHGSKALLGHHPSWYQEGHIHRLLHTITDHIPPFSLLHTHLPDNTDGKLGIVWEILLIVGLVLFIRWLDKRAAASEFKH